MSDEIKTVEISDYYKLKVLPNLPLERVIELKALYHLHRDGKARWKTVNSLTIELARDFDVSVARIQQEIFDWYEQNKTKLT